VTDPNRRRRQVLRALSAAGLTVLAGCGDSGVTTESTSGAATSVSSTDGRGTDPATTVRTAVRTDDRTTRDDPSETTAEPTRDETTDATEEPVDPSVVAGLQRVAVPFDTATLDGLEPAVSDLADARVVGMGEATHGTREFQTARAALVRGLVADAGFRAVAFEENFGSLLRANEYVTHGEGTLAAAMAQFRDYLFRTETVRDLVEWLRAFNEGRPEDDRVGLYGVDVQNATDPTRWVRSYLQRVDPEYLETSAAAPLLEVAGWSIDRRSYDSDGVEVLFSLVESVRGRLQDHRAEYVAASSRAEWDLALRSVWTVEASARRGEAQQAGDSARERLLAGYEVREETMAANADWIQGFSPSEGVALWAHNSHVQRGTVDRGLDGEGSKTMGEFVADRLGAEYHPLVLTFGSGRFTARGRHGASVTQFTVEEPAPNAVATVLTQVDYPAFYVDFDAAAEDSEVAAWLEETNRIHRVGSVWGGEVDTVEIRPRTDADGLLFVRETTATTPLPADENG